MEKNGDVSGASETAVDPRLLEILACPFCRGDLGYSASDRTFTCLRCTRVYGIRDGVPILLVDEAIGIDPTYVTDTLSARGVDLDLIPSSDPLLSAVPELSATFFPWSTVIDEAAVKRALLYFDKVNVLGPSEETLPRLLAQARGDNPVVARIAPSVLSNFTRFFEQASTLMEAGVLATINAETALREPETKSELSEIVFQDCLSADVARMVSELEAFAQIVGDPADRLVRALLVEHSRTMSGELALQYWTETAAIDLIYEVQQRLEAFLEELPKSVSTFVRQRTDLEKAVCFSTLCNVGLAAIRDVRSAPLVTGSFAMEFIQSKYRRMFSQQNDLALHNISVLDELVARTDTRSGVLANMAFELLLPDLSILSYEDILEVRDSHADSLGRFRLMMTQLQGQLHGGNLDRDLFRECESVIHNSVVPAVLELQADLRGSRVRTLRRIANKVTSFEPAVPFVISAFSPLPLYAAALVSAGVIALDVALAAHEESAARSTNGVTYIMDLRTRELSLDPEFWSRSRAVSARYGI